MKLNFNEEQIALLKEIGLNLNFTSSLSEDDIFEIDDRVADHLINYGIGEDDMPNHIGLICESILEVLSDL
ncbi:MAG: hypothetical protein K0R15_1697 [Clostridiales bacterium]|jgi:hypothetical protein|nr:hypothetical protein [Clostridiales bacterium]